MADLRRYLGQALLYALFFLPIVYLTQQPLHTHMAADMAELKVAVRHAGQVIGECVPIGGSDQLPSNLRQQEICPRERSPLQVQLLLNGASLYRATVPASGLHNDGLSSLYQRFTLPAGRYHLKMLMNDDTASAGPTWTLEQDIELQPAQVMVATFKDGFRLE